MVAGNVVEGRDDMTHREAEATGHSEYTERCQVVLHYPCAIYRLVVAGSRFGNGYDGAMGWVGPIQGTEGIDLGRGPGGLPGPRFEPRGSFVLVPPFYW
jgi:hypothetical protein